MRGESRHLPRLAWHQRKRHRKACKVKDWKTWEPSDADELTPAVMHQIVCDVEDGSPDPDQVMRLLRNFVECTKKRRPYAEPLLRHLANAFAGFLDDSRDGNLERLLGLRSPPNRPTENTQRDEGMARDVLTRVLRGETVTRAKNVLAKPGLMASEYQKAWNKHKHTALTMEKIDRIQSSPDGKLRWTSGEERQLAKYFRPSKVTP